ncbi:carbohydrate kinase family protein [Galbibacter sp.]|uniref:carbohydrate kinase family protein n=1 Tax=Galbibacter sp. TaxID=2918471 RepID=UPI003A959BE2
MDDNLKITCYGEVLWDVFPTGEKIGGAPLNVAIRLQSMGVNTGMISCVGNDVRGQKITDYLRGLKLNTSCLEIHPDFPTGIVQVTLDKTGSATYDIKYPVAWDKISLTPNMVQAVESSDAFIYGSLVCRDPQSKYTLFELIPKSSFKVLDVNLRQGYYSQDLLLELIQSADFIKFNDDELFEIAQMMGSTFNSLEQNLEYIKSKVGASSICVTKGRHGALLVHNDKYYYNSGYKITVKDTVGAGDSFLATLLVKLLRNEDTQRALDFACGIGAMVAAESGANPVFEQSQIDEFINGRPLK